MRKKEEKSFVEDTVSDIYNKLIWKLDEKYDELPNARKSFILNTVLVNYFIVIIIIIFFIPPLHHKYIPPIPPLEDYKKISYVTTIPIIESNRRKKIKILDSKL